MPFLPASPGSGVPAMGEPFLVLSHTHPQHQAPPVGTISQLLPAYLLGSWALSLIYQPLEECRVSFVPGVLAK